MMKSGGSGDGHSRCGQYVDFLHHLYGAGARPGLSDYLQELREEKTEEDDRFNRLVEEWKATAGASSFEKWRSEEVGKIDDAWRTFGKGTA